MFLEIRFNFWEERESKAHLKIWCTPSFRKMYFPPSHLAYSFLMKPWPIVWIEFVCWIILCFLELKSFSRYELNPSSVLESRDGRWTQDQERWLMCPLVPSPAPPWGCSSPTLLRQLFSAILLADPLSTLCLKLSSEGGWLCSPHFTWQSAPLLLQSIYYLAYCRIYLPHCLLSVPSGRL